MKISGIVLVLSLVFLLQYDPSVSRAQSSSKIMVYYFHGEFRCHTCMRIENLTLKTLRQNFSKELADGVITWQAVNIDDKKNKHFIHDYKLNNRSVVVSKISGGGQITWKNLDKIWNTIGDESLFIDYIRSEVKAFIK